MDGHVFSNLGSGDEEEDRDMEASANFQGFADSDSSTQKEQTELLEDDCEQPDGQRSSLSLDEDGGTHFEPHSQETIVRRAGHVRDTDVCSPLLPEGSGDNDVVFNPVQRLNFDDDDDDEEDEDNEQRLNIGADSEDNITVGNQEYISHRPIVHGCDIGDFGAYNNLPLGQDQGHNIRIIEGHDSSLLDSVGNAAFGFQFFQTQAIHTPLIPTMHQNSGPAGEHRAQEEIHNLYDSLEREDGASLFGDTDDQTYENQTSDYFSAGNLSLLVANPQVSDCDTLWAQDDGSDHGSYLSHPQQQQLHAEQGFARQQNSSQNVLIDVGSLRRRGECLARDNSAGGCGDVQVAEGDNTSAQTVELSEEGLSHVTQIYAQPLLASCNAGVMTTSGNNSSRGDVGVAYQTSQNGWTASRLLAFTTAPASNFDNSTVRSVHPGTSGSLRGQLRNQGSQKDEILMSSHLEGDGLTQPGERHSATGSSSVSSHLNIGHVGDVNQSSRRPAASRIQPRRPAVQGSASSSDNKKSATANLRPGMTVARKNTLLPGKSGSHNDATSSSNVVGMMQSNKGTVQSRASGRAAGMGNNPPSRVSSNQGASSSSCFMVSRSNSLASQVSSTSSSNSRIGGVGKESHMGSDPPTGARIDCAAPPPNKPDTNYHLMTMAQRLAGVRGYDSASTSAVNQSAHTDVPQQGQQPHQQLTSSSCDRMPQTLVQNQSEQKLPISFTKHLTAAVHPPSTSFDPDNDPLNIRPADSYYSSRLQESQNFSSAKITGAVSSPSQEQSTPHAVQPTGSSSSQDTPYLACSSLPPADVGYSPSGSEGSHNSERDVPDAQKAAFMQQGIGIPQKELSSYKRGQAECEDIQGIEDVRSRLHSMLHMHVDNSCSSHIVHEQCGSVEMSLSDQSIGHHQLYQEMDTNSFMTCQHQDDMTDILENFPSFSSKIFSDMPGMTRRNDSGVHSENQYLRDTLEKERYRRKHCEEHIQKLNTKLLELQQQLAVAVSTDKRKDLMIEQLDKQLAKVVEGWKKREAEKDELLRVLRHDKEQLELAVQNQQMIMSRFEQDLAQKSVELLQEKEKVKEVTSSLKTELNQAHQACREVEEMLKAEREKHCSMVSQWQQLEAARNLAQARAEEAQHRLSQEQDQWHKKEQELNEQIRQTQEACQTSLALEKVKYEDQTKKREEAEAQNEDMKSELKKVVLDMEQLLREKETQKVEKAIMESKYESAQRKIEADLHAQMEKEIADQAAEFHARIEASLEEATAHHLKQIGDLQKRHQHDLERQAAAHYEELQKKDEDCQKQLKKLDDKLQEMRAENISLGQAKIKLESQRMEILTKLQYMMQSQWNEAVSLLVSTPHKKSLNSSFLSSQSASQPSSSATATDTSAIIHNLASNPAKAQSVGHVETGCLNSSQVMSSVSADENSASEGQDSISRMDRVEEYLQRLPHNVDIPVMRNELEFSGREISRGSSMIMLPNNNRAGHTARPEHHSSVPAHAMARELKASHTKASNNLSHSQHPLVTGYVSASREKMVTPPGHVGDHITGTEARYQAVAMRSPQQSSSRYSSASSHHSVTMATARQSPSSSHTYTCTGQRTNSPQHYTVHHHHHELRSSPHQPVSSDTRHLTGDFGDHKEVKQMTGQAANINLFRPDSPGLSSPTGCTPNHWSASGQVIGQRYPGVLPQGSAVTSSPTRNDGHRPCYSMESPVKRYRAGGVPQLTSFDEPKTLSPPVKQKAERDPSDETSDVSSSASFDTSRLQASYSHTADPVEEHQSRQGELQHYVRMLLQKAPGSVCSEPERDQQVCESEMLESSRESTVDLDLNDTATAAELTGNLAKLQLLREREIHMLQRMREKQPPRTTSMAANGNPAPHPLPAGLLSQSGESLASHMDDSIISSQRLAEISNLLNFFSDQDAMGRAHMTGHQLDEALRNMGISSSTESLRHENKRIQSGQASGSSSKSLQVRKSFDMSKSRSGRPDNQTSEASVPILSFLFDVSQLSNQTTQPAPVRKASQPPVTELPKDKKTTAGKHPGQKTNGGPAWK